MPGPVSESAGMARTGTASTEGGDGAPTPIKQHGGSTAGDKGGGAHTRGARLGISGARRARGMTGAGDDQEAFNFVRPVFLYRTHDHGVTAASESVEERAERAQKCRTTGWQSRFAVPYRPLGTPEPELHRRLDDDHDHTKGGGEPRSGSETFRPGGAPRGLGSRAAGSRAASSRGAMTARAMLESPVGNQITPSGRPTNWLPESERAMVFFSLATRRNSRAHHKILLASVQESEARVKMVRAGQMATDVLVERRTDSVASKAETEAPSQVFLTGMGGEGGGGEDMEHPLERQKALRAAKGKGRPMGVPALRLPGTATGKGAPSSRLLSGLSTSRAAASPGAASTKAGDASVVKTAVGEEGGLLLSQPTARVLGSRGRNERRANAVAGNHVLMHPVPPLKLVAETFFEDVEALTSRVHSDLSANSTERMDTFRRKFKNFQLGEAGSTAEAQLQAMRVSAEQEKLRNEIYLYQNRKWYSLLMHQVADNSSDEQRELLKKISEMVEGGVITKATVRELLNIMSERGKVEHFTSKPIQAVFEFLCEQFGVLGQEYDSWLEDNSLPLPPSTLSRYEAARQKRLQLFQRDLVAKHWRQRFDMLSTTKNLADWLPDDVVDAVIETARQLSPRSHSARSVNSSHAPSRSAQSRPQSSTSRRSAANNLTIERSLDNLGQDVPLNPAKDDGGGDNASGEEAGGEMQPVPSMGASVLMADMGEAAPAFEPAAPLGAPA